jgi:hypothetical protein
VLLLLLLLISNNELLLDVIIELLEEEVTIVGDGAGVFDNVGVGGIGVGVDGGFVVIYKILALKDIGGSQSAGSVAIAQLHGLEVGVGSGVGVGLVSVGVGVGVITVGVGVGLVGVGVGVGVVVQLKQSEINIGTGSPPGTTHLLKITFPSNITTTAVTDSWHLRGPAIHLRVIFGFFNNDPGGILNVQ